MKQKSSNAYGRFSRNKYVGTMAVAFRESVYYPKHIQASIFLVVFRTIILFFVYSYAFAYINRTVNGMNANTAVWSMAIYSILLFTQFRLVFKKINDDVRKGMFETHLTKPYDYLIFTLTDRVGKNIVLLLVSIGITIPLLIFLTGGVPETFEAQDLVGVFFLVIGGALVSAGLYILVSLPVFWIDDATPFYWLIDKAILIFGGAYIPIALLPVSFQKIALLTPFGAPMFATQMFNENFAERWYMLYLIQLFWVCILFVGVIIVFRRALKKVSVNGG